MRTRNIKNAIEKVNSCQFFIANPLAYKGKWKSVFDNDYPIHIEIGMGKGKFINEMAMKNKEVNYIGIEKFDSIILRSCEKATLYQSSNLRLILLDAQEILNCFSDEEVDRIYLNFSDPWPKNCHAKRRLTHENFLKLYEKILKKDGEIHFKTDNRGLFEFSLQSLNNYNMLMKNISLDLHNSKFEGNITTEYEEKFSQTGPIYRLEGQFRRNI